MRKGYPLKLKANRFSVGGYASAGFAKASEDATAVKPWSFTDRIKSPLAFAKRAFLINVA
jgi:hypothetical protein